MYATLKNYICNAPNDQIHPPPAIYPLIAFNLSEPRIV